MPDIYPHSGDAQMRMDNESTWAGARNAATAETINTTAAKNNAAVKVAVNSGNDQYDCYRYFAAFDTSGISVKPDSATLKLYGFNYTDGQIIVIKVNAGATGGASADFVAGDYSQTSSTTYSAEFTSTLSTSGYNEITLNDAALTDMASLSSFKIAVIDHDFDYSNQVPPGGTTRRTGWYFVNESNASLRPLISYVEGTPAPSTPTFNQGASSGLISDDFTINSFSQDNLSVQFDREGSSQVPFILGGPGPLRIRGKVDAQVVKKGDKKN